MTEDRIKAIAWELVKGNVLPEITLPLVKDVIKQLLEDYCIVEREKVVAKYNAIKYLNEVGCQDRLDLLEDLFGTSMFNPKEAEYTEQCQTCMRKLAGEIIEVCKDSTDENRHCKWNGSKNQDFCAYKIFWDRYPEAHWQRILLPEQFVKAKSLNQNEE